MGILRLCQPRSVGIFCSVKISTKKYVSRCEYHQREKPLTEKQKKLYDATMKRQNLIAKTHQVFHIFECCMDDLLYGNSKEALEFQNFKHYGSDRIHSSNAAETYETSEQIIDSVLDGSLDGFVLLDGYLPKDRREDWRIVGPFFKRAKPSRLHLSPSSLFQIDTRPGYTLPKDAQLLPSFHMTQQLLSVSQICYLWDRGVVFSNVQLIIELNTRDHSPFAKWITGMITSRITSMRKSSISFLPDNAIMKEKATAEGNMLNAQIAKLLSNALY